MISAGIQSIRFPKAFFKPGETARWVITLNSNTTATLDLVTTITYLNGILMQDRQTICLGPDPFSVESSWLPPAEPCRGYGLDIRLEADGQTLIASRSSSFDVLERWTQHPRYGFLTDFSPGRDDCQQTLDNLLDYHINGLQFYDWMYRHDQYLTAKDPYLDPLGRLLSLHSVEALIGAAHARGMAAMPYTAVYAASIPFYEQHKDWALYQADGKPYLFGENFLVIMDPRPETPWTRHLLNEFANILSRTDFDGIHLDQYYSPQVGYDLQGNSYRLEQPLAGMINSTKDVVATARDGEGAVIFNAVTNWPVEAVAPSKEDVVYIEIWPPYTSFNDLGMLVTQAQELGGGKPVVIAAYIDPAFITNALLMDAIIFANGGGRIELGEHIAYLADAYFPRFKFPSIDLRGTLQRYYEFALRYQNVIGPQTRSNNQEFAGRITLGNGIETDSALTCNRIMPVVRESTGYTAINLINLLGLENGEWAKGLTIKPTPLSATKVTIGDVRQKIAQIWFATPDAFNFELQSLDFTQTDVHVTATIPALDYWDMILIKWCD